MLKNCHLCPRACGADRTKSRGACGAGIEIEAARASLHINLVTGAHYVPQIIEALQIARKQGLSLPVVYNSSGYEQVETLQLLDGHIDIYLPDYNYYSSYYAGLYSHA